MEKRKIWCCGCGCDEVDRLTCALEEALARDCPRGDDCDMSVAYMAGARRTKDKLRAENERLRKALCRLVNELELGDRGVLHGVPSAIARARAALRGGVDEH